MHTYCKECILVPQRYINGTRIRKEYKWQKNLNCHKLKMNLTQIRYVLDLWPNMQVAQLDCKNVNFDVQKTAQIRFPCSQKDKQDLFLLHLVVWNQPMTLKVVVALNCHHCALVDWYRATEITTYLAITHISISALLSMQSCDH